MKPEIKEIWVNALESGEYKQGTGVLCSIGMEVGEQYTFCCLGVLCDLASKAGAVRAQETSWGIVYGKHHESLFLPEEVMDWAGIDKYSPDVPSPNVRFRGRLSPLSSLNDGYYSTLGWVGSKNFAEIAQIIKENL